MTNTKDRNDCWLGMGAAQLVMERQDLCKQRDELLAATEAIAINSEECLDFDECTAMLVSIDDYHTVWWKQPPERKENSDGSY